MAKPKKAATKEVVVKKHQPLTRRPRVPKAVDQAETAYDVGAATNTNPTHRVPVVNNDGPTAQAMRSATKPKTKRLPTMEELVSLLAKHGIHFNEE